jgi:hypothetical protein
MFISTHMLLFQHSQIDILYRQSKRNSDSEEKKKESQSKNADSQRVIQVGREKYRQSERKDSQRQTVLEKYMQSERSTASFSHQRCFDGVL